MNIFRHLSVKRYSQVLLAMAFILSASVTHAGEHGSDHDHDVNKKGEKISEKKKDRREWEKKHESKKGEKAWKKKHEPKKEEIMREISFLAKKLLDSSGKDKLVLTSPAVLKPFLGVCPMVDDRGIKLTCITPASQADKNGLKTGDIITAVNGAQMARSEVKNDNDHDHNHPYWGIMNRMKTDDVFEFDVLRAGETIKLKVTVGSISHPSYELKISR